jgi:nucleoside phosphorylase
MEKSGPFQREDYRIGVVCALAVEKAAVRATLDEEHPPLERLDGDDSQYTLGRIGVHNVVIACLPAGDTGTANACNVATHVQRSFQIKYGLMVGIAGGV